MKIAGRRCLVCDCEGTMALDGAALARGLGSSVEPVVHHQLCRRQLAQVQDAATAGVELLIGCTQEAALFEESLANGPPVTFVNIRERAGWSAEGAQSGPKIAALLAEAALAIHGTPDAHVAIGGPVPGHRRRRCGAGRRPPARAAPRGDPPADHPGRDPAAPRRPVPDPDRHGDGCRRPSGRLHGGGRGSCGGRGLVARIPALWSGAGGGTLETDLIVDLGGGQPLFPAPAKRDGYLRCDPRDPVAVQRALYEAAGLVGEFEKPHYITYNSAICAHSRSRRTGCTRCLDQCPTGAIVPAGDFVRIEPFVCAGCGACAGVCPTGAATYTAPPPEHPARIACGLLGTYLKAGGADPVLLVHEDRHGGVLIDAMARAGRGLPARVLPFAVTEIAQLGFEILRGRHRLRRRVRPHPGAAGQTRRDRRPGNDAGICHGHARRAGVRGGPPDPCVGR